MVVLPIGVPGLSARRIRHDRYEGVNKDRPWLVELNEFFDLHETACIKRGYFILLGEANEVCRCCLTLQDDIEPLLQGSPVIFKRKIENRPLFDVDIPKDSTTGDRKSTRLNSSHANISYAVF